MEDQKNDAILQAKNDEDAIDLGKLASDLVRISKRLWWIFFVFIAAGVGIMYAFSYMNYQPMYRCEATFTISTSDGSDTFNSTTAASQLSTTFPYILDSSYFRSVLMDKLGTNTLNGTLSATAITNSNMVTMRAESSSPDDARSLLDAALSIYPEVSRFVLGNIEFHLLDDIQTSTGPYNAPSWHHILGYGVIGGFAISMLIVFITALFSNTIQTVEDMEKISSLPCLGALPDVRVKARKKGPNRRYLSILDPRTPHGFRESVQALDVRIRDFMQSNDAKVLLVTSSVAGEGKSTVAINLAEQLAKDGDRVLLIDFDLRRQHDSDLLGCKGGKSVAEVLQGDNTLNANFIQNLKKRGFFFWGGKHPFDNPAKILTSSKLSKIISSLRSQMDYVILDTPPCGLFPDAAILADYADAALLVVQYDKVSKAEISEALTMLQSRHAKVLGYVFNSYPQSGSHYGYGYGRYGYGKYGYGSYGSHYGTSTEDEIAEDASEDTTLSLV